MSQSNRDRLLFALDWEGYPMSGCLEQAGRRCFFQVQSCYNNPDQFGELWLVPLPDEWFQTAADLTAYWMHWSRDGALPILNPVNYRSACATGSSEQVMRAHPQITPGQWRRVAEIVRREAALNAYILRHQGSSACITWGRFVGELKPRCFLNRAFVEWRTV